MRIEQLLHAMIDDFVLESLAFIQCLSESIETCLEFCEFLPKLCLPRLEGLANALSQGRAIDFFFRLLGRRALTRRSLGNGPTISRRQQQRRNDTSKPDTCEELHRLLLFGLR